MKKKMLIVAIVFGLCGTALALDKMGPPTAELGLEQWGLGIDYMYSDMDLGVDSPDGKDMQTNKVFGTLSCGAMENVDLFVRVGIARVEGTDIAAGDDMEHSSSEFAWGVGGRWTFAENENCKWGSVITFSQNKSEEHEGREVVDFDELQIAVGPTVTVSEDVTIYGGPFYHHVNGDAEDKDDTDKSSLNTDGFGGYLGAKFKIKENAALTTEFQLTDDAVGFGAGFMWTF